MSGHNKSDILGSNLLDNPNPGPNRDLSVHGERKDDNTVKIKLRIAGSPGLPSFLFCIFDCSLMIYISRTPYPS